MIQTLDRYILLDEPTKPRIAGHRITVAQVAFWHEVAGLAADEIATTYGLTLAEVYAALAYYFDNQALIDLATTKSEEFVEEMRRTLPSKLTASSSRRMTIS